MPNSAHVVVEVYSLSPVDAPVRLDSIMTMSLFALVVESRIMLAAPDIANVSDKRT